MFKTDIVAIPSDHNDECEVCDEPGDLICCDFCNTVLLCLPCVYEHACELSLNQCHSTTILIL